MPTDNACRTTTGADEMKWMRWVWRNSSMKFVLEENGRNPDNNLPRSRFVQHETYTEWSRCDLEPPVVRGERLTACALSQIENFIRQTWHIGSCRISYFFGIYDHFGTTLCFSCIYNSVLRHFRPTSHFENLVAHSRRAADSAIDCSGCNCKVEKNFLPTILKISLCGWGK